MKRMIMILIVIAGIVSTGTLIATAQSPEQEAQSSDSTGLSDKTWKRGLEIAPVALNLEGKNKKRVGEGSYIVNTNCVECHTNPTYLPGGNPYRGEPAVINTANYLAGGTRFGPFVSANITPDARGLPAGLTFEQFVEVFRTGKDFKARHPQISPLLQVMPWAEFSKKTDEDLRAIYEYLSAIPHAEPAP